MRDGGVDVDNGEESGLHYEYRMSGMEREMSFEDWCDLLDKFAIAAMNTLIWRLRTDATANMREFAREIAQSSYYFAHHMIRERAHQCEDIRNAFSDKAKETKVYSFLVE